LGKTRSDRIRRIGKRVDKGLLGRGISRRGRTRTCWGGGGKPLTKLRAKAFPLDLQPSPNRESIYACVRSEDQYTGHFNRFGGRGENHKRTRKRRGNLHTKGAVLKLDQNGKRFPYSKGKRRCRIRAKKGKSHEYREYQLTASHSYLNSSQGRVVVCALTDRLMHLIAILSNRE